MDTRTLATVGIGGATYLAAIGWLALRGVYPLEEALAILVVLGVLSPLLAWSVLRKSSIVPVETPSGGQRANVVIFGLLAFVTGYLTIGAGPLDALLPPDWRAPGLRVTVGLLRKLVVFVAIPWIATRSWLQWRAADFGLGPAALRALWGRHGVVTLVLASGLCAFQWLVGRGAAPLRTGEIAGATLAGIILLSFAWNAIEAGLVEEFFFRALLQTRLAALAGSPVAGGILAAIVFGLAHAPGYALRGGGVMDAVGTHPGVLDAIAYAIAVPSVAAIPFVFIWARTRNLYACVILHGAVDMLPNAFPLAQALGLH